MIDLVVDAAAVYRITRFVTADVLSRPTRVRIIRHVYAIAGRGREVRDLDEADVDEHVHEDRDPPKTATLITCPWCASPYIAAAVVVVRRVCPRAWDPVARVLAYSAVAGLASGTVAAAT